MSWALKLLYTATVLNAKHLDVSGSLRMRIVTDQLARWQTLDLVDMLSGYHYYQGSLFPQTTAVFNPRLCLESSGEGLLSCGVFFMFLSIMYRILWVESGLPRRNRHPACSTSWRGSSVNTQWNYPPTFILSNKWPWMHLKVAYLQRVFFSEFDTIIYTPPSLFRNSESTKADVTNMQRKYLIVGNLFCGMDGKCPIMYTHTFCSAVQYRLTNYLPEKMSYNLRTCSAGIWVAHPTHCTSASWHLPECEVCLCIFLPNALEQPSSLKCHLM